MWRLVGCVIVLVTGVWAICGVRDVLRQDRANRLYVEVPATVYKTGIREIPHRHYSTYAPAANYGYVFGDRQYYSTRVLALERSADEVWARGIARRISVGDDQRDRQGGWTSVAYIDPSHPEQAILIRDYSFDSYWWSMLALVGAAYGACLAAGAIGSGRSKMSAIRLDDLGWHLLLPRAESLRQLRDAVVCFWVIGGAVIVMPLHWTLIAGQSGAMGQLSWLVAIVTVGGLGTLWYFRWSVCHHIGDARLRIRPAPAERGKALEIAVNVDALKSLKIAETCASIVCIGHYEERQDNKTVHKTQTCVEIPVELSREEMVAAGQEVRGKGEVLLDANLPKSGNTSLSTYPYFTWEIRLIVKLVGTVDYSAVFPLTVL